MKRAAISGVTGMIGAALAEYLAAEDVAVLALVNPHSARTADLPEESELITHVPCGLDDYAAFAADEVSRLPECDAFYHFAWAGTTGAARNDAALQQRNVEHACDAVRLAHALGCKRFIFAGSQAECGPLPHGVKFAPETPANPQNEYAAGKARAAAATRELAHELGMEHAHVRIGSVYGPRDGSVLTQALLAVLRGKSFACTPGEQLWDHLFAADAADAFWRLGTRGSDGAIYCLGSGQAVPLRDHIAAACHAVDPVFNPQFGAIDYPPNQPMYLCADIASLRRDTGFSPRTSFEDGITQTAAWLREHRSDLCAS